MKSTGRSAVVERAMAAEQVEWLTRGLTAVLLLAVPMISQGPATWVHVPSLHATNPGPSMAHDEARGRTVLVDRGGTWEWNGTRWMSMHRVNQPQPGWIWLAYDPGRRRVILVNSRGSLVETWEWDGIDWVQRNPASSPPGRNFSAVAFDRARGKLVLFGGNTSLCTADTWEWDGLDWQQATPAVSPIARQYHALAFDEVRQRVVLFGGQSCGGGGGPWLRDTWEWDGGNWTQRFPGVAPPVFIGLSHMTYDAGRQRVVLIGDYYNSRSQYEVQTWEWDGGNWTRQFPTGGPPLGTPGAALAYDRTHGEVVRSGGWDRVVTTAYRNETWTLSGAVWTRKGENTAPSGSQALVVWDGGRGRVLVCPSGAGAAPRLELYEWDGATLALRPAANAPPKRWDSAMVYDRARLRAVLFGGSGSASPELADTWEWDGNAWLQRTPPQWPAPRRAHAMAYDPLRQRVVLFGGHTTAGVNFGDTWTWDGVNWTQNMTSLAPSPRFGHVMAFDGSTQRVLLFGGSNGTTYLAETWLWDGNSWSQAQLALSPPVGSVMAFDALRQRTVLCHEFATGTWEWDGSVWAQVTTTGPRVGYWPSGMAYDEVRQHLIQFGGDIWRYGLVHQAVAQTVGTGCTGSAGTLAIQSTMPRVGMPLALDLHRAPPGAPCLIGFSFATQNLPIGGGCTLYLQNPIIEPVFAVAAVANAAGFANVTSSVPDNLTLRGLSVFVQAFALDPQGPAFGLVFSNGLELVVGD